MLINQFLRIQNNILNVNRIKYRRSDWTDNLIFSYNIKKIRLFQPNSDLLIYYFEQISYFVSFKIRWNKN